MSSKRNSTLEVSTPSLPPHDKIVTFIEIDGPTPAETAAADEHVHTQTKRSPSRTETTRGRSTISGRSDNGIRGPYGWGGTNDRGYNQYQSTTPSGDWRDKVKDMMSDLKTNIMKEVQMSISTQIKELAMTLTTQVTNAIKERLSMRPDIIPDQHIENETEIDIEPIAQESQPTNEDITDMDLEVDPRKSKERSTNKTTYGTTVITPTRLSR